MSDARRSELWLVDLGEPAGHEQGWTRPALVVSSDGWNRHAGTAVVLPLTRTRHGFPTRVEIESTPETGLDETSYARCEDVRSVSAARLVHRIGVVEPVVMAHVARVLRIFLEL